MMRLIIGAILAALPHIQSRYGRNDIQSIAAIIRMIFEAIL